MKPSNVLTLPGWQNSGPTHWQSLWEERFGYQRVQQHDWMQPLRGDWITRLEDELLSRDEPVVLVAHSLGCILTAAWASVSRNTQRVKAALLVAPGDAERPELQGALHSWRPIPMHGSPSPASWLQARPIRIAPSRARAPWRTAGAPSSSITAMPATSTRTRGWPAGPRAMCSCRT